jgi:hypothetical protein
MLKIKNIPFALLIVLFSCNSMDRKKTFLDFDFGMTYQEFNKHAYDLQKSGIISNLNDKTFEYIMHTTSNKPIYLKCNAFVYSNMRLKSIGCELKYAIGKEEKDGIVNSLISKYGNPTYTLKVNSDFPDVSNVSWSNKNDDLYVTMGNSNPTNEFKIEYRASGDLYKNIEKKDKKENGIIDVNNKY